MSLPLTGVTVLDLTRVLAGPYATMVLGRPDWASRPEYATARPGR